jgi:uncharacterized protein YbbK (DUF523 family)/uncharacterized protein YbgA (DUF1722 family)
MESIRLGVSSCLLGRQVRFDGGHKRSRFLTDELESLVEWVPLCPEVDAGLTVPRPSLRLVSRGDDVAVERSVDGADLTALLSHWSHDAVDALANSNLDGYVLMQGSPSCGLERVKVYGPKGSSQKNGQGVFASALVAALPHLPVEEEGRLRDPRIREAFFERVFAGRRLREMLASDPTPSDLIAFHARHKLQLLSHSPNLMRSLGRVVATAGRGLRSALVQYATAFPQVMAIPSTRGRHVNVLEHAAGYLRGIVGSSARLDVLEAVRAYSRATVPLVVPVTLVSHRARTEEIGYLERQTYLAPYPSSLGLRNAI